MSSLSLNPVEKHLLVPVPPLKCACGVWIIAGPHWREHIKWRIQEFMKLDSIEMFWMGSGSLGYGFPPSRILDSPRKDIGELVRQWSKESLPSSDIPGTRRVLIVEDPHGAGIWSDLNRAPLWKTLLENSAQLKCSVIIGTDVGIPRSGILIDCVDWVLLRSSSGDIETLTSGTSSLGGWLDGIGRDIFDDIRVYRRLLSILASHKKDMLIQLSSDNENMSDRIFWWDSSQETLDLDRKPPSDLGADAMITPSRLVRKLRLVIGLLEELCEELEE